MQSVLWDVMRAESYSNHFISMGGNKNLPEENARFQKQIFSIHHITRAEFNKSFSYYNSRPDLMKVLLDSIIAKAGREKNNNPFLVPKIESVK